MVPDATPRFQEAPNYEYNIENTQNRYFGGSMAYDFFISYASRDEAWASWLAWQLEDAGYTTFFQAWDFRPGQNFVVEMQRGTVESTRTLAVLTSSYFEYGFTKAEWNAAFARDPEGKNGLLLPVRVEECDIEGLLGQITYINLVGLDEHAAGERLLTQVRVTRAKPSAPPGFPGQVARPVYPPAEPQTAGPAILPRLHSLLKAPIHSYHLTMNSSGELMWSYTILRFRPSDTEGVLRARALHTPKRDVANETRSRYEYETEASFDHHHLFLHTHFPDRTDDDIFVRMFPNASRCDFPLCGVGFLAHTWYQDPATTISILSDAELECARGATNGECISDPKTMRALQAEWEKAAEKLHFVRLPRGVTVYRNWDRLSELLGTVTRDEGDAVDLRIVTIAFSDLGWPEDKLTTLAKQGLRIKILLTDPDSGEALVRARNKIRWRYDRTTPQSALAAINAQIRRLQDRKEQVDESKLAGCTGDLDFALSDLMPYGFAAISNKFVVLGLFLATGSYGIGPMLVFDPPSHKEFCESLKEEWNIRWKYATLERNAEVKDPFEREYGVPDKVISDTRLITSIEARTPDDTDIWVASPDLSNVGDNTSGFAELVRNTVVRNARRGVNYLYICPHGWAGTSRLETLQQCFGTGSGTLHLCEVPPERFLEFTLVPTHFITFSPLSREAKTYMQLPLPQAQKGWIALGSKDGARIVAKIQKLLDEYPPVKL